MKQPTKESTVPLAAFHRQSAKIMGKLKKGGFPVVLTQNGKAAAVLLDPDSYDQLVSLAEKVYQAEIRAAIERGRAAASKGEVKDHETVLDDFDAWLNK